jgi:hypothetical protein
LKLKMLDSQLEQALLSAGKNQCGEGRLHDSHNTCS